MRPIDADALKKAIELLCEDERTNMTAIAYFALLELVDTMPTIEAEPVKQDTELSIILQDYGIKDTDTLRYILDQYQKIIVDITGGQMSYLTYSAETVIACADDNYRKCHEESMKHGRWIENSDPGQNINEHYMCSECGCTFHNWANDNYCPNCGSKNRIDGDSE